jgi:hypothetical protein
MWVAAAIIVATVLYLIDKNKRWGAFWKSVGGVTILALLGVGYLWYSDYRSAQLFRKALDCGTKIRAAYPQAMSIGGDVFDQSAARPYSDLDDATLGRKVLAKYPTCDVKQWVVENVPPYPVPVERPGDKWYPPTGVRPNPYAPKKP